MEIEELTPAEVRLLEGLGEDPEGGFIATVSPESEQVFFIRRTTASDWQFEANLEEIYSLKRRGILDVMESPSGRLVINFSWSGRELYRRYRMQTGDR